MKFTSIAALKAHIEKKVAEALKDEVATVIRDVHIDAIQEEVYDAYPETVLYRRRMYDGGLADPDNMPAIVTGTTLVMRNVTQPNEEYDQFNWRHRGMLRTQYSYDGCERSYVFDLPALIEYGDAGIVGGYTHKHSSMPWGPTFLEPRPFMQRTKAELRQHKYHVNALNYGLRKKGLRVKN